MTGVGGESGFQQRLEVDGLNVEFTVDGQELLRTSDLGEGALAPNGRDAVDAELLHLDETLTDVDSRIDRLTNRSDGLDYAIAVASGVLAGIVDSVWVGELSLVAAHEWGAEQVNNIVMKTARDNGYTGDDLSGAIKRLEDVFPFAGDKATKYFGGGTKHHLRDLTHHPSPVGLVASIVMQFTGRVLGVVDQGSRLSTVDITSELSASDIASGLLIGKTVPEKFLFGTVNWLLHLVSDMAGSYQTAGLGTGLPGVLLATVHEAGALFGSFVGHDKQGDFMKWVEGAFSGKNGGVPFDLRTELGLTRELGRQALPVLLNEAIVRAFFFIRRAVAAVQAAGPQTFKELLAVDLRPAQPWGNRTITRMLAFATSTFTAVDLLDAAVRAAIASGGEGATFAVRFVLRVNFVGVARTSIAIGVDLHQGWKRSSEQSARISLMNQKIHLLNARTFYKVGDVWTAAGEATTAVQVTGDAIAAAAVEFRSIWTGMGEDTMAIERAIDRTRAKNPALLSSLQDDLEWSVE